MSGHEENDIALKEPINLHYNILNGSVSFEESDMLPSMLFVQSTQKSGLRVNVPSSYKKI